MLPVLQKLMREMQSASLQATIALRTGRQPLAKAPRPAAAVLRGQAAALHPQLL